MTSASCVSFSILHPYHLRPSHICLIISETIQAMPITELDCLLGDYFRPSRSCKTLNEHLFFTIASADSKVPAVSWVERNLIIVSTGRYCSFLSARSVASLALNADQNADQIQSKLLPLYYRSDVQRLSRPRSTVHAKIQCRTQYRRFSFLPRSIYIYIYKTME